MDWLHPLAGWLHPLGGWSQSAGGWSQSANGWSESYKSLYIFFSLFSQVFSFCLQLEFYQQNHHKKKLFLKTLWIYWNLPLTRLASPTALVTDHPHGNSAHFQSSPNWPKPHYTAKTFESIMPIGDTESLKMSG